MINRSKIDRSTFKRWMMFLEISSRSINSNRCWSNSKCKINGSM